MEVITATNVLVVDENLWYCPASVSTFSHFASSRFVTVDFLLCVVFAFTPQQHLGADAEGAGLPRIDFNVSFHTVWMAS
jgi:hypothetical protein